MGVNYYPFPKVKNILKMHVARVIAVKHPDCNKSSKELHNEELYNYYFHKLCIQIKEKKVTGFVARM